MSKRIFALALAVIMLLVTGCAADNNDEKGNGTNGDASNGGSGVEERNENGDFVFKGRITSLDSSTQIEMEIVDSKVAFGTYWVLVGSETKYENKSGNEIKRSDLKVGDIIEVTFSGQVMMSLPPRISAWVITLQ